MKIEQTQIIKIKPKQKKLEMQKQNEEGQQIDFASNGESFEERQKAEEENSEQVLPAQINKLETMEKLVQKDHFWGCPGFFFCWLFVCCPVVQFGSNSSIYG